MKDRKANLDTEFNHISDSFSETQDSITIKTKNKTKNRSHQRTMAKEKLKQSINHYVELLSNTETNLNKALEDKNKVIKKLNEIKQDQQNTKKALNLVSD